VGIAKGQKPQPPIRIDWKMKEKTIYTSDCIKQYFFSPIQSDPNGNEIRFRHLHKPVQIFFDP
jgi:hypothetical protein